MAHRRLPIDTQKFKDIAHTFDGLTVAICNALYEGDLEDEHGHSVQYPRLGNYVEEQSGSESGSEVEDPDEEDEMDIDEEDEEDYEEGEDEDEDIEPSDENLTKSKESWKAIWQKGKHEDLAMAVMRHETKNRYDSSATTQDEDTSWAADVFRNILFSSHEEIIESTAFGNLARDRRRNTQLQALLNHLRLQAKFMPSTYHQQLVDKKGLSPTCNQVRKALSMARDYIFGTDHPDARKMGAKHKCQVDDKMANKLDQTRHDIPLPLFRQSFRNYLWTERVEDAQSKASKRPKLASSATSTGRISRISTAVKGSAGTKFRVQLLSDARVAQTINFCDRLQDRLDAIPAGDQDKPLAHPLMEVGYSKRSIERLKKHAAHESSNYLMNLFEAIFEVLASDPRANFPQIFLEQHIIYLIWRVEQAEISEIGWTKLAEGYTCNAGGFSHYPAGQSNYSAQKVPAQEWSYASEVALTCSPWEKEIEAAAQKQIERYKNIVAAAEEKSEKTKQDKFEEQARRHEQLETLLEESPLGPGDAAFQKELEEKIAELRVVGKEALLRAIDNIKEQQKYREKNARAKKLLISLLGDLHEREGIREGDKWEAKDEMPSLSFEEEFSYSETQHDDSESRRRKVPGVPGSIQLSPSPERQIPTYSMPHPPLYTSADIFPRLPSPPRGNRSRTSVRDLWELSDDDIIVSSPKLRKRS